MVSALVNVVGLDTRGIIYWGGGRHSEVYYGNSSLQYRVHCSMYAYQ